MKKLLIALTILAASPVFMATSCKKDKSGCPQDVICTAVFMMVNAEVLSASQQPIVLDDVYTIRVSNGDTLHFDQTLAEGGYVVLDDSFQDEIANSTENFRLIGMKNGQKIVDEMYQIGADCCHIDKKTGLDEIVVTAVP